MLNMDKKTTPPSNIDADLVGAAANAAKENESPDGVADYEKVKQLAHEYWHARGCPEGSPEEDWLRAEQAVKGTAE
jgi:hypothetical protein